MSRLQLSSRSRYAWALVLAALVAGTGCVQRRMTIRSNPPGALVYVDNYEIGTTPVSTDFVYYGTREVRLVKDGYETLTVKQPIPSPWYQYFPIDFFAENVVPGEIRDERVLDYQLIPQVQVSTDQLLQRADGLRQDSRMGPYAVPASFPPAAAPPPASFESVPPPAGQPVYTLPPPSTSPAPSGPPSPGYAPYP